MPSFKKIFLYLVLSVLIILFFVPGSEYYIQHADYSFPLEPSRFIDRHIYLWSYNSGSMSIDSTIRVFSRFIYVVAFKLYGDNLGFSYFFGLINTLIIYLSGYVFTRYFLELKDKYWSHLLSLFLVLNPVFLGNFSKLGLLFAVGLLLLLVTATKKLFQTSGSSAYWFYACAIILLINFSFVHPFNFLLNVGVFFGYFLYYGFTHKDWINNNKKNIALSVLLGIGTHLYILVSVLVTGSLDKSVISNSIGQSSQEQFLLDIANNKSIFESFTLAKSVFIEYDFYPENGRYLYLFGIALLYLGLGILFFKRSQSRYNRNKLQLIAALVIFLLLLLITTGAVYDFVERGYTYLYTNIPGGWAFRSPLKFQLFVPVMLIALYALLVKSLPDNARRVKIVSAVIMSTGILFSSTYLVVQVYQNLLTPKEFTTSPLDRLDYEEIRNKRILYVSSEGCRENKILYPEEYRKLIYYFNSRENTFTVLNDLTYENQRGLYDNFDYVIRCDTEPLPLETFAEYYLDTEHNYSIWRNTLAQPVTLTSEIIQTKNRFISSSEVGVLAEYGLREYAYAADISDLDSLSSNVFFDIYNNQGEQIASEELTNKKDGYYIGRNYPDLRYTLGEGELRIFTEASVKVYAEEFESNEVYADSPEVADIIVNGVTIPLREGEHKLASLNKDIVVKIGETEFQVPSQLQKTNSPLTPENNPFELQISDYYTLQVSDPRLGFENGLWTEEVGNCFNYDDNPQIGMSLNSEVVLEGENSLFLSATRHNACTNLTFSVEPEDEIQLVIPYYTTNPERFVYQLTFNDTDKTVVSETHFTEETDSWSQVEAFVDTPPGATEATLRLEVPQGQDSATNTFYFDDIRVSQNPQLSERFFYTRESLTPRNVLEGGAEINKINPVEYDLTLRDLAAGRYYLLWQENFHPGWQIDEYLEQVHFRARGLRNGWVLDVEEYCKQTQECVSHGDNTYTVNLKISFAPQKSYFVSLFVSGLAIVSALAYIGIYLYRHSKFEITKFFKK